MLMPPESRPQFDMISLCFQVVLCWSYFLSPVSVLVFVTSGLETKATDRTTSGECGINSTSGSTASDTGYLLFGFCSLEHQIFESFHVLNEKSNE